MARLVKGVAQRTDNFKKIDEEYAYSVWLIEKEFNVGKVTDSFLAMKFWHLLDSEHIGRYNKAMKGDKSGNKGVNTFG